MRLERTLVLPAPTEEVWRALTEPEGLTAWFGAEASLDRLTPGARVEFRFDDGAVRAAVLEEVERHKTLTFRWLPFARRADGSAQRLPATRVEFTLAESEDGTVLDVVETAPDLEPSEGARA
jgi:uncharacterized protein YndB with AHSA1/START domain